MASRSHPRFDRMERLVGDAAMAVLRRSHALVLGLGGVGSWAAEALARSGFGRLTLVDPDEVGVTDANRQIHALDDAVGVRKAAAMGERLRRVNPEAEIRVLERAYDEASAAQMLSPAPDAVVDAIDSVGAKCHLLAACRERGIPVVTSVGSGGRLDPTAIRVTDLAETAADPLARDMRRILREKHGFPSKPGVPFGIPAVWSAEPPRLPLGAAAGGRGRRIYGTAPFVTGAFGLACASVVVRRLLDSGPDAARAILGGGWEPSS